MMADVEHTQDIIVALDQMRMAALLHFVEDGDKDLRVVAQRAYDACVLLTMDVDFVSTQEEVENLLYHAESFIAFARMMESQTELGTEIPNEHTK